MDKELKKTSTANQDLNTQIVAQPENSLQAEALIQRAIDKGVSIETMERLLAMRTQLKAEWAKEQFDSAMAKLQAEMPIIKKEKEGGKTNSGQVAYYYAPLEEIVRQTKEMIGRNGFSYAIKSETLAEGVSVTVFVKHKAGHTESSNVTLPLGTKTNVMSAPQVTAAAITFASRYAFKNAFGIMTGDNDNDGQTDKLADKKEQTPQAEYYCETHDRPLILRPAGKTKQGVPYNAFWACAEKTDGKFCKGPFTDSDGNRVKQNPESGKMEVIEKVHEAEVVFDKVPESSVDKARRILNASVPKGPYTALEGD